MTNANRTATIRRIPQAFLSFSPGESSSRFGSPARSMLYFSGRLGLQGHRGCPSDTPLDDELSILTVDMFVNSSWKETSDKKGYHFVI